MSKAVRDVRGECKASREKLRFVDERKQVVAACYPYGLRGLYIVMKAFEKPIKNRLEAGFGAVK